ncbi:DUF1801 domain-containing protein [Deminuibacter soli]|uniref:DUF1801 domain-containing protein n=1 Tax=Deminuibacter soli TaxID=2291815 RepID=A0A3E1NH51_9BACT|nr:DUF1801 domain-containing protein [Deminuibacter soli]RFM27286.1 hypothetical protein DXN05_14750 [Deminuibacter soli]
MKTTLEAYYTKQPEAIRECLLALKAIVLRLDARITHVRKFQIPFFYLGNRKLAFLWVNRKKLLFGFVTDKSVLPQQEGTRKRNHFETIEINPDEDIPQEYIVARLQALITLYDECDGGMCQTAYPL